MVKKGILTIVIGGVAVLFSIAHLPLARAVRLRYRGYIVKKARATYQFDVSVSGQQFPGGEEVAITRTNGTGSTRAIRRDFSASWNCGRGTIALHPSIWSFDAFLRVLYATILPEHKGMVLHASAVIRQGHAYVFAGKSGSGKTTMARLCRPARILNDEIIAVTIGKKQRRVRVWGTPFWGAMGTGPSSIRPWPVAAIFLIHKGNKTIRRRLDPVNAVSRLLACVCLYAGDDNNIPTILELLSNLASSLQIFQLWVPKKAIDWEAITRKE
jgi:hypothetical protein